MEAYMHFFHNDYNEMCHPAVMEHMNRFYDRKFDGYGMDECCRSAADKIRTLCNNQELSVHFLVGGTQTNLTVIAAALRPHQAAIGAVSAHINVHETGAVEATGHKVIGLPSNDGKITAQQVETLITEHRQDASFEHIAQPKLVYISDSTELGTIYTLSELEAISAVCRKYGLYLFVDGARLGYALAAADNDVTLADLARLCDVFYIGGTKVGAMFGEAVVISNPALAEDFRYLIKQRGAMLAKGWLLGIQFDALMTDDLYLKISAHADEMADRIRTTLESLGYKLYVSGGTNQIFPVLPDELLEKLSENFTFSEQVRVDAAHRAVRFCTSWATKPEAVNALCEALIQLSK
jgi:threonine aldolase